MTLNGKCLISALRAASENFRPIRRLEPRYQSSPLFVKAGEHRGCSLDIVDGSLWILSEPEVISKLLIACKIIILLVLRSITDKSFIIGPCHVRCFGLVDTPKNGIEVSYKVLFGFPGRSRVSQLFHSASRYKTVSGGCVFGTLRGLGVRVG